MQITLPPNATTAALRRAELAGGLAAACPPTLGDEIALVGSTAHGYADDESDLELNLWAEVIPPLDERLAWLRAAGAEDIHAEAAARSDDSYWIGFRIGGLPGEVGWQTIATAERQIAAILSGAERERKALVYAEIVTGAIPVRTGGALGRWQAALAGYSDAVEAAIIGQAVERWARADAFSAARRLARRGETLALTELLLAESDMAARVVYAAHRRWEPSRKWTLTVLREFAPDAATQIDAVLSDASPERRVELCRALCMAALKAALKAARYDVTAALRGLEQAALQGAPHPADDDFVEGED